MANKWSGQYLNTGSPRTELLFITIRSYSTLTFLWVKFLSLVPPWFHLQFGMPAQKWLCLESRDRRGIQGHAFWAPFRFYSYCEESCIPTENMSDWKKIMTQGLQKDLWNLDLISFHKLKASFLNQRMKESTSLSSIVLTPHPLYDGTGTPIVSK